MARFLIVYGTTEGHTARVADRMAATIRSDGHEVDLRDSKDLREQAVAANFDGVIVGGSVHAGDHQGSLRDFVKRNRQLLERVPSAFFSVSLAAADPDEEAAADARVAVDKFIKESGWRPAHVETIAGALVFTQYNIFIRHLMKLIAKHQGRRELDTSRDYDFTDWDAVERFAREFARSNAGAEKAAAQV